MDPKKDALTTGEVAKICNVAPRTVSKWVDSGQLRGYRIPGSRDRRIPVQQLIHFMKAHNIPLNGLDPGNARILIADADIHFAQTLAELLSREKGYEVKTARCAFEAGASAAVFKPHALVLDTNLEGFRGSDAARIIRAQPEIDSVKVIATTDRSSPVYASISESGSFDAVLGKPFLLSEAAAVIERVLGILHS